MIAASDSGVPESGHAVRMEAVDQPIEHDAGEVVRVVVADLQARQRSAAAAARSPPARTPGAATRSDTRSRPTSKLSFITTTLTNEQVGARAGAERAADRVDRVGDLLGVLRRRALIEQRGRERRDARLVCRILRAAGADEQPQADRRLLVMRHRDHLQAVRQRPDLVRRKLDLARRQRPRRPLGRPVRAPAPDAGRRQSASATRATTDRQARDAASARLLAASAALRHDRQHEPVLGREVGLRDALDVGGVMFMKMSNSPSAVLMSLWMTTACAELRRLVLVRLAAEDVVARELVLRLLQLVLA